MAFRKALANQEEPKYIRRLLIAYLLFTLVSFSGNFNAFYSYFMNDDLITKEITEKMIDYTKFKRVQKLQLSDKREVELTSKTKEQKLNLAAQIRDPKNKGLGLKQIKS